MCNVSTPELATDPQIYRIIKSRGLTQVEADAILRLKQPHVSALMRYRSGNFSVERLLDFSIALVLAPSIREECKDCYARTRRAHYLPELEL